MSIKSNGDIIDFEGRVVGHINLEDMKDKITADEVVALVDKIDQLIKKDGYFVGIAYNDKDGLAHLIIDKGEDGAE